MSSVFFTIKTYFKECHINVKTEQEKVVEKMKKVLNFLEHVQITNQETLVNISKPLDDLLSSLKYLPIEPFFTNLPIEMKTDILSYLCKL